VKVVDGQDYLSAIELGNLLIELPDTGEVKEEFSSWTEL
jgi:hypothetical protein